MNRVFRLWALVLAILVMVPFAAAAGAGGLTWKGYRGVRPGQSLSSAGSTLGSPVVARCGAHAVVTNNVVIHDRASGGNGRATAITTTRRTLRGPDDVHVGMTNRATARALGHARTFVVSDHLAYLLVGPSHRALWTVSGGKSPGDRVTMLGLSPTKRLADRAVRLTVGGCPPPPCPDPLPTVGQYMTASCDASTGRVSYACHPDWTDADGTPADGCEREVQGLVPMTFATHDCSQSAAALVLTQRIAWGVQSWSGCACLMYGCSDPTPALWQDPAWTGTVTTPTLVECSADTATTPSYDCPGGTPVDPPPGLALDLVKRAGDQDPVVVAPQDADTDHVTIRVRASTEAPVAFDYGMASPCQLSVDSTAGSTPVLTIDLDLVRTADPVGPPAVQAVSVTGLESSDWWLQGSAVGCFAASDFGPRITSYLTDVAAAWAEVSLTRWCGAPDPYWWQDCPVP